MKGAASNEPRGAQDAGRPDDAIKRSDYVVGVVLAVGLAISILLLLTGAILALVRQGPLPSAAISLDDLSGSLAALEPGGFLALGLLVLLATPVARVAALAVGFARIRSWVFFWISVFVLALIALSAYLGLRG